MPSAITENSRPTVLASSFAEMGLGVSKSVGDILGPCAFAVLMGLARVIYAGRSEKINLSRFMLFSAILCIISGVIYIIDNKEFISQTK